MSKLNSQIFTKFSGRFLWRSFAKSAETSRKYGQNFRCAIKYSIAFIAPIFKNFTNLNGIMWKTRVFNFTQIGIKYGKYGQTLFYYALMYSTVCPLSLSSAREYRNIKFLVNRFVCNEWLASKIEYCTL